jgi:predicted PurR-regulated permease PerM
VQENQNAFQNAGSNGYSYYVSIANQSSTFFVLVLAFVLLMALLKSEERYRKLLERIYLTTNDR